MIEYFDVVNEQDEIIGKASREQCHSNPKLIHRGVFVIVVNSKAQILLSKRSMKKDTNPCRWEVLGEHNKLGESYENGAKRGLKEELGIYAGVKKIAKLRISSKRETEFDEIFVAKINGNKKINFDKDEISEVRFVSIKQLKKEIKNKQRAFSSWSLKVLKEYFRYRKI